MKLRIALGLLSVLGALALSPAGVTATDEPGVAFLDDRDLEVALQPGMEKNIPVEIVNGGPKAMTISLRLISSTSPNGAPALALTGPVAPDGQLATSGHVGVGEVWAPILQMSGDSAVGLYSARLVALGGDGTHASRNVNVTIKAAPTADDVGSEVFREPIPDPLTLHAERNILAWFDQGQLLSPIDVAFDPTLASEGSVGPLIDDRGRLAHPRLGLDGKLTFSAAPGSGTYKGTFSKPDATGTATKLTTVTLTVRDFFLWPLVVLLVGLALAFLLENWFTKIAPRQALEVRLLELQEQSARQAEEAGEELRRQNPWFGANQLPVSLWEPNPPKGLLVASLADALADFNETPTAAKREDRWGAQGSEFLKVGGYLESQSELGYLAIGANQSHADVISVLGARAHVYEASPLGRETRSSLSGTRIDNQKDLQKLLDVRRGVTERVAKATELGHILHRLEDKASPAQARDVEALWTRLSDMPRGSLDEILSIAKDANQLWDRLVAERFRDESYAFEANANEPESLAWAFSSFFAVDTGGGLGDSLPLERTSERIRKSLARGNLLFAGTTAALVLIAGFGTQYLANPAFGSEADYAALLVWSFTGAAAAQFLKYLASTVRLRSRTAAEGA